MSEYKFKELLNVLPLELQEKNSKFLRWQDRHANLFGKLLLLAGLKKYGYDSSCLKKIQFNANGRPFLDTNIDFNISHSGEYVLCAFSKTTKIGIDIEKITSIDFNNFDSVMTIEQMNSIKKSKDSIKTFFNYWTIKESFVKADGRGLEIPLLDIEINSNTAIYNNRIFFLNIINIDKNYCCNLASNSRNFNLKLKFLDKNLFFD
ncbi:MAG: 4'-phosphopantetheinyl transferase [Psychroserpens sp.]|jgi:4'-phosphopantetheinyl transferase